MALFMDVHTIEEGRVAADDVAGAHAADLQTQGEFDVKYLRYWVSEDAGQDLLPGRRPRRGDGERRAPRGPRPRGRRDLPGVRGDLTSRLPGGCGS